MQFEAHHCTEISIVSPECGSRLSGRVSSNREVAVVQADLAALANDLEQANGLTATLELQLSGKVNELAQFKHLWERTRGDVQKLELDLEVLRRERHNLANQVQRSYAVGLELDKLKRAHEDLKARTASLESELGGERVLHADARRNVEDLKDELAQFRQRAAANANPPSNGLDADTRANLLVLRKQLDKLLNAPTTPANGSRPAADTERIEITYER